MNLRERTLRLAVAQPDLRDRLLPLVRKQAKRLPRSWIREVSKTLSLWDQVNPLAEDFTVADAMRMGAAQWAWDLMKGENTESKWLYITDEPGDLERFLERSLQRAYEQSED